MIEIVPALDIREGRCVRLAQGDFSACRWYSEDALTLAKRFEALGFSSLHLVDLDGALQRAPRHLPILQSIATQTKLAIDFSGGITSDDAIEAAFNCGASEVTCGTIALHEPDIFQRWLTNFGPLKVTLAADVKDGKIAVRGWTETSVSSVEEFLSSAVMMGVRKVLCTDVRRDGMMLGPSLELYRSIRKAFPSLGITASGGVRTIEDVLALQKEGLSRVVVGRALLDGAIGDSEVKEFLCFQNE